MGACMDRLRVDKLLVAGCRASIRPPSGLPLAALATVLDNRAGPAPPFPLAGVTIAYCTLFPGCSWSSGWSSRPPRWQTRA